MVELTRRNPLLSLINEYLIDSPAPINLSYFWGFGSLSDLDLLLIHYGALGVVESNLIYVLRSLVEQLTFVLLVSMMGIVSDLFGWNPEQEFRCINCYILP